jgi:hypothetical protein
MRTLLLVVLLLAGLSAPAQFRDTLAAGNSALPGRNPVIAVALSMLMPGAGQLYKGEGGKAALHFGLFAGSVTWVILRDIGPTNADIKPLDWLSAAAVGTTYIWAAIDAGVIAEEPPKVSGREAREEAPPSSHLSFGTFACRGGAGISFSYHF